jgi:MurNAc alpha-1-phosphate uridylyltransferase
VIRKYSKRISDANMRHIDYGLSILTGSIFESYRGGHRFDLGDVYAILASQGRLMAFEIFERFYEIGSVSGLEDTKDYFIKKAGLEK